MALSYFGSTLDQAAIAQNLRFNDEDKNVNPSELAARARELGYQATVRVNGNAETLRRLLSNGLPILIETWLEPEPGDGFGHYRLLTGYDDRDEHWIAYDSYVGVGLVNPGGEYQGIRLPFAETDELWKVFNRTYIVIYHAPHRRRSSRRSLATAMACGRHPRPWPGQRSTETVPTPWRGSIWARA